MTLRGRVNMLNAVHVRDPAQSMKPAIVTPA
jgi:hypothetical protein